MGALAGAMALLLPAELHASHLRAGEIIYERFGSSPYGYRAHIFTYVKTSSGIPDPELYLNWGDSEANDTLLLDNSVDLGGDVERREYIGEHVYSGFGVFELKVEIPYRNNDVLTIPGSGSVMFSVRSMLVASPLTGDNTSVRFLNAPIQNACYQKRWTHNPVAYDPDGDSLSYEAIVCTGVDQLPVAGYSFPDEVVPGPGNQYAIDPLTGTITWDASQLTGEYNVAFIVKEWRNGNMVGSVVRDMQITVVPCLNDPPEIDPPADTCVVAGTALTLSVTASDPNPGDLVTLAALGEPFVLDVSPASFISPPPANNVTGIFSWQTDCAHVRLQPYQAVFSATDNDPVVPLEDFGSTFITIVGPAPQNPTATPNGAAIDLAWDASICTNVVGYKVYRRSGSYGFTPSNCETGVPAYTGYALISGSACIGATSYTDNDELVFGNEYCYMVVACFPDGAESYASVEFCAILDRQVPLITKVSVGTTDVATGVDTVSWSNAYDLDVELHPGPYQFKVYRGENFTTATTLCFTSSLWPTIDHPDTTFEDVDIDTRTDPQVYRVELWGEGGGALIGESNVASSVFLTAAPDDEQVTLTFPHNTPWNNTAYDVYRFNGGTWDPIGTTTDGSYVDTALVNGEEYCYYVVSTGAYSDPQIVSPLINYSQEVCAVPVDLTPPCPPELTLDNDCEEPLNTLTWTDPNTTCADDTWQYHVWFQDSVGGEFILVATIIGATDTTITHVDGSSVSGCYAVTAIDSVGNESAYSNVVCGDNCPEYDLPNVFTPNGDQSNEFFVPFPYRGVKRIDLQVFNRWGQVVFETEDPAIGWNGLHKDSNEPVTEGVYFYLCTVTFARLAGEELKQLTGYVHLLRGSHGTLH